MKAAVKKLRLGPLPRTDVVKLTIAVSAHTKSALDRYAHLHSQLNGSRVDAVFLVPYMLEAFMEGDRAFKSFRSNGASQVDGEAS